MTEPNPPSATLPWPAVGLIFGAALLVCGAATLLFGNPAAAMPALYGLIPGLLGSILAQRGQSHWPALATLAAIAFLALQPTLLALCVIGGLLTICAGIESVRSGGRACVLGLYGWLALDIMPGLPPAPVTTASACFGLMSGWLIARLTKLEGAAALPPVKPIVGLALVIFLALGLAVSLLAMGRANDQPYAYWIPLFFILRAVAPPQHTLAAAAKFGLGAVFGCLAAFFVMLLHLPTSVTAPMALLLIVGGLRYLPNPSPIAPAAFSAATMIGAGADLATSVFRIETALFVAFFAAALAVAVDLVLTFVGRWTNGQTAASNSPGS